MKGFRVLLTVISTYLFLYIGIKEFLCNKKHNINRNIYSIRSYIYDSILIELNFYLIVLTVDKVNIIEHTFPIRRLIIYSTTRMIFIFR